MGPTVVLSVTSEGPSFRFETDELSSASLELSLTSLELSLAFIELSLASLELSLTSLMHVSSFHRHSP